ncbi:MAG: hypothetical protein NC319_03630 [Butyricicoccus sp.]|nr:hypothetical protein [Butyricicoccus sp.]
MKDFSEIKNVVLSSIGKAADAGKGIANKAADMAKSGARIARLTVEIASEKENMKKAYMEIGKLYYDTHKDDPEGFFIQLCDEVALAQKNIADKEAEIDELKLAEESEGTEIEIDIDISVDGDDFEKVVEEEEASAEPEAEAAEEEPAEEPKDGE